MNKLTLVVLAAGMGSRYGGLKQIDPLGPNGEILMDYSLYDASVAGFDKVVFIIRENMREAFENGIGNRVKKFMQVEYAIQDSHDIPSWFSYPEQRNEKPWGTAHAILSCKNVVTSPFVVINADDFYGRESYKLLADYLLNPEQQGNKAHFAMAGYILKNTLSSNGTVTRGVCVEDENMFLKDINERMKIYMNDNNVVTYTGDDGQSYSVDANSLVSLNIWGFTPEIFAMIEDMRDDFFKNIKNIEKEEFLLPKAIDEIIKSNKADVKILRTSGTWYGVTYREDRETVCEKLKELHINGIYPQLA